MNGVLRFRCNGKLSPRFIRPIEILDRMGPMALPPSLSSVHDVFHVSILRKYIIDPTHVIDYELLQIDENLNYEKKTCKDLGS